MARADVVKVSADDLAYLDPGAAPRRRGAGARSTRPVGRPADRRRPRRSSSSPRPAPSRSRSRRSPVVDTVGAGDAFGGGFLARWIERGLGRADLADARRASATRSPSPSRSRPHLPARRGRPAAPRRARLATVDLSDVARLRRMPTAIRRLVPVAFAAPRCSPRWRPGAAAASRDLPEPEPRQPRRRRPGDPGPPPRARRRRSRSTGSSGTTTEDAVKASRPPAA